jgi:RNA polymerase sigma-70 factor (ECF subfamily)
LLFVWADLSYDEVATALGIPAGTVRSRIHRARRVLREHLADARRFLAPIEGGET